MRTPSGGATRVGGLGGGPGGGGGAVEELGVGVVDVAEGAGGEEAIAEKADLSLDASLLVAAADGAGSRQEVVVTGELEQAGMKLDRVAVAREDGALEIVVEQGARGALEVGEGLDVPAQEALQRLVEGEQGVDRAGPGEHHHEGGQRTAGLADAQISKIPPLNILKPHL